MDHSEKMGEVKVSDEVLLVLAGLAATDVEGVYALAGGVTRDAITTSDVRNLSKAVKVLASGKSVTVKLALILKSDSYIPAVSKAVQEKVADAIVSMAGLQVGAVDITITGVEL